MRGKILLVDDDPLVLKSFVKLLRGEGYEVLAVTSYEEALDVFEREAFDLVLSDIRMPGKNGVETVQEIQSRLIKAGKRDLPIVFITGYADYADELKASFVGEVLTKPVDNDRLLMTLREYL